MTAKLQEIEVKFALYSFSTAFFAQTKKGQLSVRKILRSECYLLAKRIFLLVCQVPTISAMVARFVTSFII